MLVGAGSHVGKVRETNEDCYFTSESVLIVADGMGGHNAGEVASKIAVEQIRNALSNVSDLPDGLVEAFQTANQAVFKGAQEPGHQGMGTTLTCAVIRGDSVYVAHVGDSRACLIRDSQLIKLSVDHSVVGELVRSGNLSEEEAKIHPHRHFLTRALGTDQNVAVDVQFRMLKPQDGILLCTDGLTGVVENQEILEIVSGFENPQSAVDKLIELANSRGGPDNITVVLAKVEG